MLEAIGTALFVIFLIGIAVSILVDATWLTLWVIEPLTRVFQRVILGIDKVKAGPETLLGKKAKILESFCTNSQSNLCEGSVWVDGETWRATASAQAVDLVQGTEVTIRGRKGLVLEVEVAATEKNSELVKSGT